MFWSNSSNTLRHCTRSCGCSPDLRVEAELAHARPGEIVPTPWIPAPRNFPRSRPINECSGGFSEGQIMTSIARNTSGGGALWEERWTLKQGAKAVLNKSGRGWSRSCILVDTLQTSFEDHISTRQNRMEKGHRSASTCSNTNSQGAPGVATPAQGVYFSLTCDLEFCSLSRV